MGVTWVGHPDSWNKETRRQMQDWLWFNGINPNDVSSNGFQVRPRLRGGWTVRGYMMVRDEFGSPIIDGDCMGNYKIRIDRFKVHIENDPPNIAFTPTIKEW